MTSPEARALLRTHLQTLINGAHLLESAATNVRHLGQLALDDLESGKPVEDLIFTAGNVEPYALSLLKRCERIHILLQVAMLSKKTLTRSPASAMTPTPEDTQP